MATLVLTTVGAIVGGPIGASIGAAIGNTIDQSIFAPKGRSGPRLDDLSVQSSAYGAPHPHLFGTVRAAGNIIWSSGLKETANREGGGKRSGGSTTTYSYSASFAVALAGRPISGIGRIWGDGKLLRGASGELTAGGSLRVHTGGERQAPDPLIVAAEGTAGAPAYRGIAYAVFEDLELGDFANRIPNLSFEVIADPSPPSVGAVAAALCTTAGSAPVVDGLERTLAGYAAARNAPLSVWLSSLSVLTPIRVGDANGRLRLYDRTVPAAFVVGPRSNVGGRGDASADMRTAAAKSAGAVSIGFFDPDRDYLAGLQRAFRAAGDQQDEHFELPGVMSAADAKRTAQELLQRRWRQRRSARRRLTYASLALTPGDRIMLEDGTAWEVRRTAIEAMRVELELEPSEAPGDRAIEADAGRANGEPDLPQGETLFELFELPPIDADLPALPRIWLAAAGTGAGWRRAEVWVSRDAGLTWSSVGLATGNTPMGTALGILPAADAARWDESGSVEVELISDVHWLQSRSALSVLAGANLALLGEEIIQFRVAEPTGPRRFRLSGLLRGRRATEDAAAAHIDGERFVLLGSDQLFRIDAAPEAIGGDLHVRLVAPNATFAAAPTAVHRVSGRALQPLAPVRIGAEALANGDVAIRWTRRSRNGFGWIDFADAPLGEDLESYRVRCLAGLAWIDAVTSAPQLLLTAAEQIAAFGTLPALLGIEVAQMSSIVGGGRIAARTIPLAR